MSSYGGSRRSNLVVRGTISDIRRKMRDAIRGVRTGEGGTAPTPDELEAILDHLDTLERDLHGPRRPGESVRLANLRHVIAQAREREDYYVAVSVDAVADCFALINGKGGPDLRNTPDRLRCPDCGGTGQHEGQIGGDGYGGKCAGVADVPMICNTCDGTGEMKDDK